MARSWRFENRQPTPDFCGEEHDAGQVFLSAGRTTLNRAVLLRQTIGTRGRNLLSRHSLLSALLSLHHLRSAGRRLLCLLQSRLAHIVRRHLKILRFSSSGKSIEMSRGPRIDRGLFASLIIIRCFVYDPSAGSPTETLLRLLLPLKDQVRPSFSLAVGRHRARRDCSPHDGTPTSPSEGLTKSFNR